MNYQEQINPLGLPHQHVKQNPLLELYILHVGLA